MRYRQTKYGAEIDGWRNEAARLASFPKRAAEREQALELANSVERQMRADGKRRSSGFYGLRQDFAPEVADV